MALGNQPIDHSIDFAPCAHTPSIGGKGCIETDMQHPGQRPSTVLHHSRKLLTQFMYLTGKFEIEKAFSHDTQG